MTCTTPQLHFLSRPPAVCATLNLEEHLARRTDSNLEASQSINPEGAEAMNPFHSYTFTWWQVGLFKISLIALGLAVGATWSEIFVNWLAFLWVLFLVPGLYLWLVAFRQC